MRNKVESSITRANNQVKFHGLVFYFSSRLICGKLHLKIAAGGLFAGVTALINAWLLPAEKQMSDTKYYYACIKYDEGHENS